MAYLTRPDAAIYHEVSGGGSPLVFAHGLGGNHLSWWQQVPHFQGGYTCVTFAHRGFYPSRSPLPAADLPAHFVDDLEALLDELRLDQVALVAQSMGGWTCLGFALRHPERVRALVMADTAGSFAHGVTRQGGQEELFARGIHPAAGERMAREQPAMHHLYWGVNNLAQDLDKQAISRALLGQAGTTPAELAALTMPVLGIAGAEDRTIAPEAVRRLCAALPNARFAEVPETGHSVYWERPARFNELVDEFLAGV
ncbi:MAG: alpha/beta fold hydrolase [Candidatus Dormibacteraceae bacterium]